MTAVKITNSKQAIAVLWPSFIGAAVFAGLLFAFIDPLLLTNALEIEHAQRLTGYSICFVFLWVLGAVVAWFSIVILRTPDPLSLDD